MWRAHVARLLDYTLAAAVAAAAAAVPWTQAAATDGFDSLGWALLAVAAALAATAVAVVVNEVVAVARSGRTAGLRAVGLHVVHAGGPPGWWRPAAAAALWWGVPVLLTSAAEPFGPVATVTGLLAVLAGLGWLCWPHQGGPTPWQLAGLQLVRDGRPVAGRRLPHPWGMALVAVAVAAALTSVVAGQLALDRWLEDRRTSPPVPAAAVASAQR